MLPAYAGRTMQAELEALDKALDTPQRPVAAIVGGAKVSTKLDLLGNLLAQGRRADHRRRHGQHVPAARRARTSANRWPSTTWSTPRARSWTRPRPPSARSCCRSTPSWRRSSRRMRPRASSMSIDVGADDMILDIGPRSVEHVVSVLARAKTLVWNGPFGAFEMEPFDNGTVEVAEAAAELTAGRQACLGRGRRRHGGGAQCRRRRRPLHLCLDRRRRLPGMAGRQGLAGRRGAAE